LVEAERKDSFSPQLTALKEQAKSECGPEMAIVLEEMLGRSMLEIQTITSKSGHSCSVWAACGATAMADRIAGVTSDIQRIHLELFVDGDVVFRTTRDREPGVYWLPSGVTLSEA
jgi:hypothetical protein